MFEYAKSNKADKLKLLLDENKDIVNEKDGSGRTALIWAASKGYTKIVALLLQYQKINVNAQDANEATALILAALWGQLEVAELLLKHENIKVDLKDKDNETALMKAVRRNYPKIVDLLLKNKNINVNEKNKWGQTALLIAGQRESAHIIGLLLKHEKIDVNASDNDGNTPLIWAVKKHHPAIVELLLKDPRVNSKAENNDGDTALTLAKGDEIKKILQAHNNPVVIDNFAQALQSIQSDNLILGNKKLEKDLAALASNPLKEQINNAEKHEIIKSYKDECKELKKYNVLLQPHDPKNTLRIATYNVQKWRDPDYKLNPENIYEVIKKINADIICLQEVQFDTTLTMDVLEQKFKKYGYSYGGKETFSLYEKNTFPLYNCIFSKYELKSINQQKYLEKAYKGKNDPFRSFVGATISFNNISVRFYCTHLDVYDKTGIRRKLESEELINWITMNDPADAAILVIGDFNDPRSRDYNQELWKKFTKHQKDNRSEDFLDYTATAYENAGYKDAYETLKKRPPFTSWTGTIIDFCYLRNNGPLKFKDVNVYFDAASDHLPVIFDLVMT